MGGMVPLGLREREGGWSGERIYKNGGEKDFLTFAAIKPAELPVEPQTY